MKRLFGPHLPKRVTLGVESKPKTIYSEVINRGNSRHCGLIKLLGGGFHSHPTLKRTLEGVASIKETYTNRQSKKGTPSRPPLVNRSLKPVPSVSRRPFIRPLLRWEVVASSPRYRASHKVTVNLPLTRFRLYPVQA